MASEHNEEDIVEIGYWVIRGLREPLKLLCEYTGQKYECIDYHSREGYAAFKATQPLFCNLPYLRQGDFFLVQSNAILRHLGRKHGLLGATSREQAYADLVCEQVMDLRNDFVNVCYCPAPEFPSKASFFQSDLLPNHLAKLNALLGSNPFFGGASPLYPDFHAYEILKQQTYFTRHALQDFPLLQEYLARFEQLPALRAYFSSDRFFEHPINDVIANWGTVENHDYYHPSSSSSSTSSA